MTEYNKVVYDGQTLIDLTQDDVTASDVRNGVYFHSADGVRSQGTMPTPTTTQGTFTKSQGGITNYIVVRQFGEVVTINGWLSNVTLTANTATKIGDISNVTMPPDVIRAYCNVGSNAYQVGTLSYIALSTSGDLNVTSSNGGSGKTIFFEMAYIADANS